jgi:hypothetical protein
MAKRPDNLVTFAQLAEHQRKHPPRRRPDDEEHRIQVACFNWFNVQYPKFRGLLYHVPNGGWRDKVVAAKLKAGGVVPGVADLALDMARGGYHGMKIELKTAKGKQSPAQREWQRLVEAQGYRYIICHSLDEFKKEIDGYLLL